ncbi:8-amino-7-oxononanoate synthase [Roseiconus lacunae]|uniref:aminotransferase class I/II-fold pyridoxal phosphate-dependent enzyme n=1 Tax=Roseiconus lacunae TaxID=2605694 RepID=UPI0030917405|nr:8-amino-7-oxononanoate synthase [Stieleria sp. HD01]
MSRDQDWQDFESSLVSLKEQSRIRRLVPRQSKGIELIDADGTVLVNFGTNDYLGLAAEPFNAKTSVGGAGASALVCGWSAQHEALAERLAEFEQTESAALFPSGFAACCGTVATLCKSDDLILSDRLNHASLIDGCRLSRSECVVYPHRDVTFVAELLRQKRSRYRRVWIVTESVFSMDGHVAPLPDLVNIADRYDATLIVDEAHGTGVLGQHLSGACEAFGLKGRVPIRIGTLSKAIGSQGGFVVGPQVIVDYLINHCRPLIFSTALSPLAVESASRFFQNPKRLVERRDRVAKFAARLRQTLGLQTETIEAGIPIVPWVIGGDGDALAKAAQLRQLGLFVPAIRPPTVPPGTSRLRISLSAALEDSMFERLIAGLGGAAN